MALDRESHELSAKQCRKLEVSALCQHFSEFYESEFDSKTLLGEFVNLNAHQYWQLPTLYGLQPVLELVMTGVQCSPLLYRSKQHCLCLMLLQGPQPQQAELMV